jgi:hypothetical protein
MIASAKTFLPFAVLMPRLGGGGEAKAPDGRRGLGADTELKELLHVLKTKQDEEREFIAGLLALEDQVRARMEELRVAYEERDYFDLLPAGDEHTIDALHAAFLEGLDHPLHALSRRGEASRAFARLFLDTRFRVRLAISAGWETEAREVAAGIWVLRGMTDGYINVGAEEAGVIALRVDLSASLLRALRTDLGALKPVPDFQVDESAVTALFAKAGATDEGARLAAVAQAEDAALAMEERMIDALFSARLRGDPEVVKQLDWRARMWDLTAPIRAEALQFLPHTPEGEKAPENVQKMKRHERIRWAGWRGTEGLSIDPLDEELVFVCAHTTDFLWGAIQSREYCDRYLALRRIRAHDHKTIKGRELTEWENEALAAVQRPMMRQESSSGTTQR